MDALSPDARARLVVLPGDARAALSGLAGADVVIVDPPRRGLGAELRAAIAAAPPPLLAYVACGVTSFVEDARALVEQGALALTELTVFDLFPHTDHAEVVARFSRVA